MSIWMMTDWTRNRWKLAGQSELEITSLKMNVCSKFQKICLKIFLIEMIWSYAMDCYIAMLLTSCHGILQIRTGVRSSKWFFQREEFSSYGHNVFENVRKRNILINVTGDVWFNLDEKDGTVKHGRSVFATVHAFTSVINVSALN